MGSLASYLRRSGYCVEQEDLNIRMNLHSKGNEDVSRFKIQEVLEILKTGNFKCRLGFFVDRLVDSLSLGSKFKLIGFSNLASDGFFFSLLLARRIKQKTSTPLVFGGSYITLFGHLYPGISDYVDYMITGDGGEPLLKLVAYLNNEIPVSEVPSLIYKENGQLRSNPQKCYPLEDAALPDYTGLPVDLYRVPQYGNNMRLYYQLSRGCSGKCSFCSFRGGSEKLEFKSYDKIIRELKQLKERNKSNSFVFCDNAINISNDFLEGLCDLFIKKDLGISWLANAKVNNFNRRLLKKMKQAGCRILSFGIESGSDRILKMMNKESSFLEASQVLKDVFDAGIKNEISLICGFPHEKQEDIDQTIEFVRKNGRFISVIRPHIFSLYYGSDIYFKPGKYGIENLTPMPGYSHIFQFDEISGLKWKQKWEQQNNFKKQLKKICAFSRVSFAFNALKEGFLGKSLKFS
jgi:anaerobic magnesium-protoporphyrin IX monomethyl ester cyclase